MERALFALGCLNGHVLYASLWVNTLGYGLVRMLSLTWAKLVLESVVLGEVWMSV